MNRILLMILFGSLSVFMIYTTIETSYQSDLFEELPALVKIPWMKATLIDFYINIIVLWAWVAYREPQWWKKAVWLLLFVGLGSITVTFYIVLQLMKLKDGEPVSKILLRPEEARA